MNRVKTFRVAHSVRFPGCDFPGSNPLLRFRSSLSFAGKRAAEDYEPNPDGRSFHSRCDWLGSNHSARIYASLSFGAKYARRRIMNHLNFAHWRSLVPSFKSFFALSLLTIVRRRKRAAEDLNHAETCSFASLTARDPSTSNPLGRFSLLTVVRRKTRGGGFEPPQLRSLTLTRSVVQITRHVFTPHYRSAQNTRGGGFEPPTFWSGTRRSIR